MPAIFAVALVPDIDLLKWVPQGNGERATAPLVSTELPMVDRLLTVPT